MNNTQREANKTHPSPPKILLAGRRDRACSTRATARIAELLSHMHQTTQTRNPTCVRNLVLARSLRTVPARRAENKTQWQWLVLDGWLHQHGWISFRFAHIWEAHDEKLQCLTASTFLSTCVLCHTTYITVTAAVERRPFAIRGNLAARHSLLQLPCRQKGRHLQARQANPRRLRLDSRV